ncbi:protein particle complex subunit 13 [Seminavis robusta]|uniref:Protein particle complex subunit 13 n=1 Tax=Seminavis robusta TaxID=568900 RepID=A0A9N8EHC5_9STRA|nr:protein particle complex subunit 13 [Seminavis robusta]|eukprot:Sro1168_g248510.1 protein particle complex subunit 13 (526) ;mRNA; r:21884-24101
MATAPTPTSNAIVGSESAVPTLRVMRLQSPDLYQPYAGSFEHRFSLGTAMCLPDSLGVVYVGETFTAYLGALNVSKDLPVRKLTVSAQLQTPSQRYRIPSRLDAGNAGGGVDVPPEQGIDAIVSYKLEEAGSHILRVEVGYATMDGNVKTFRKFYRFQVTDPLAISASTLRATEHGVLVSVAVQYTAPTDKASSNNSVLSATSGLVIRVAEFVPADGLQVERIGTETSSCSSMTTSPPANGEQRLSAVQLLDQSGRLEPGNSFQYLFQVKTESRNASIRGIAAGDELGKAVFTWSKTMGETGRIASPTIRCPESLDMGKLRVLVGAAAGTDANKDTAANATQQPTDEGSFLNDRDFVVKGSGLSVDVAAAAAKRAAANGVLPFQAIDQLLPVTVEPIEPLPTRMQLAVPHEIQLLVMNHTSNPLSLQLQFRLDKQQDEGLLVCGRSFKTLGELGPQGGCTVVTMRITAVSTGLLRLQGCYIVDLTTDREIPQPPLMDVYVDQNSGQDHVDIHNSQSGSIEIVAAS